MEATIVRRRVANDDWECNGHGQRVTGAGIGIDDPGILQTLYVNETDCISSCTILFNQYLVANVPQAHACAQVVRPT